jgi:hypothetical protein
MLEKENRDELSRMIEGSQPSEAGLEKRLTALNKKNGETEYDLIELFQIQIAYDKDGKFYFAHVYCVPDGQSITPASNNLGVLLKRIRSELLTKEAKMQNAEPPPEEKSRIIT